MNTKQLIEELRTEILYLKNRISVLENHCGISKDKVESSLQESTRMEFTGTEFTRMEFTGTESTRMESTRMESTRMESTRMEFTKPKNNLLDSYRIHQDPKLDGFVYVHLNESKALLYSLSEVVKFEKVEDLIEKGREEGTIPVIYYYREGVDCVLSELKKIEMSDWEEDVDSIYWPLMVKLFPDIEMEKSGYVNIFNLSSESREGSNIIQAIKNLCMDFDYCILTMDYYPNEDFL